MPKSLCSTRTLIFILVSLALANCSKQNSQNETVTDSSAADTTASAEPSAEVVDENEQVPHGNREFIKFHGTTNDEVHNQLQAFPAFDHVYGIVSTYVKFQDSLETARELWGEPLKDPNDTLLVFPFKQKAYQAIVDYKKEMAKPTAGKRALPTLLNLTRNTQPGDSSELILPAVTPSALKTKGDFFFIGGAPFLSKLSPEGDGNYFTDEKGTPETRFGLSLQDNLPYLLSSIVEVKNPEIAIDYGGPIHTYDQGQIEVYGIGSLIHKFVGRIPAFFITEEGLVPAQLLSLTLKLGEDYNCGSGSVYVEFACRESLDENKIMGIYIPYGAPPTSNTFTRVSENLWTADLNSDGVADFAGVTNTYLGDMEYDIYEALWYANVNGTWKIIDWAVIPECT
jgi:hypothetical protein